MLPKVIYVDTQKNLGNIPQNSLGKNILKEKENTSFPSFSQEDIPENGEQEEELSDYDRQLIMAKAVVKNLSHIPAFAKKVKEYKEKFNL